MAVRRVELADGSVRWRVRFYVGTDPDTGRQEVITQTFDRKKDADREVTRLKAMHYKGGVVVPSKEPLGKYLRRWLETVKKYSLQPRTYEDYRGVLRRYIEEPPEGAPRVGKIPLHRLKWEALQELYSFLQESEGLSPRTIRSIHAVIRQGLQKAAKTGAVGSNVADIVELPKQEKRKVTAMSQEEAERFLEKAREDRYYPLWALLLTGGLRPGEALALKWDAVDLNKGVVHIERTLTRRGEEGSWALREPKTDRGRRPVKVPDFTVRALREWKARQAEERLLLGAEYNAHGFVFATEFGSPLDGANLYARNFRRILEAAELGTWKGEGEKRGAFNPKYRLYDLRHTCASNLLRAGVHPKIVSERLGHASVAFTMDVYSESLPDMQTEAAEAMETMYGAGS